MNKLDLARRLARESHQSKGKAADDIDTLVYNMLKDLKQHTVEIPSAAKQKSAPARKARSKD